MTTAAPARQRLKVVCPHDCPDTCVMTVDVEDGRAVGIGGDPDHRFTQGFLCAKVNHYLERVYSPDRILHPMKRVGAKGEGRFARITWDEALDIIADRFRGVIAAHGPQAILPYSYAGNMGLLSYGSMDRRFFGAPGRQPPRPHDLRQRGRRRHPGHDRQVHGLRPRSGGGFPVHRGLGRQHRELERPPVALHRGGAAPGREARDRRSLPLAHRREVGPAPGAAPRYRCRAGPGPDARDLPRRAGRP